jgi:hypothetical protein
MSYGLTDTQRLDAIGKHGLCVAQHLEHGPEGWAEEWVVAYSYAGMDRLVTAATIRAALDLAILDLEAAVAGRH